MIVDSKTAKQVEGIIDEVRRILYDNVSARSVEIHLSWGNDSLPCITYGVKDKAVIGQ